MDELAEYGFEDAERFAFIEKNGKVYFSSIYKNISEDDTPVSYTHLTLPTNSRV